MESKYDNIGKVLIDGVQEMYSNNIFLDFFDLLREEKEIPLEKDIKNQIKGFVFNETLPLFGMHYSLLGCISEFVRIKLEPDKIYDLDLTDKIKKGRMLYINYTPNFPGTLFPAEMHGNIPVRHINFSRKRLYPCLQGTERRDTWIDILYWYLPETQIDDLPLNYLLEAFERYYEENFNQMIIAAQTALEITLDFFFQMLLENQMILKKNHRVFSELSFFDRLRKGLPFLLDMAKLPRVPRQLISNTQKLLEQRNKIVHTGKSKKIISKEEARELLVEAFFFYKYFKIQQQEILFKKYRL